MGRVAWIAQHGPDSFFPLVTTVIYITYNNSVNSISYFIHMTWFVYILRCSDGTLYTGATTNVDRRFQEHKEGKTGAKYTRSRFPISVEYREPVSSRSEAQKREAALKKLTKPEKENFLKSHRKAKRLTKH